MTAKRRRRRSRGRGAPQAAADEAPEPQTPRPGFAQDSPFPPLGQSIALGLRVVGGSPPILAVAFLSLLATWGAFVGLGAAPDPRALAVLLPVPPVHVLGDAGVAIPRSATAFSSIAAVGSLAALRGVTYGLLCLLIVAALRGGTASIGDAVRSLPRVAVVFVGLYLVQFGLVVAGVQMLGLLLPEFAFLGIAAGLYFLAFSVAVAATEGHGPGQAVRRGVRAARLPGPRHLSFVMAYFLVVLYSGTIAPFPVLGPSTPGVAAWSYALGFTYLHTSVLAALVWRWLGVRDQVPVTAPPRKR